MSERVIRIEEIRGRGFLKLLREIVMRRERVTIILSDHEAVSIGPTFAPEPLPELDGRVPEGWKDAVYQ